MSTGNTSVDLETACLAVSEMNRSADLDVHALSREARRSASVHEGDFMTKFGLPAIAGMHRARVQRSPCSSTTT